MRVETKPSVIAMIALGLLCGTHFLWTSRALSHDSDPAVTPALRPYLKSAQDDLRKGDYRLGLQALEQADAQTNRDPYDQHVLNVLFAFVYLHEKDPADAAPRVEALMSDGFTSRHEIERYTLALVELFYTAHNYSQAIKFGESALGSGYRAKMLPVVVEQSYYLTHNWEGLQRFETNRVGSEETNGVPPSKESLQLLLTSCRKLRNRECEADSLALLLKYYRWNAAYWDRLLYIAAGPGGRRCPSGERLCFTPHWHAANPQDPGQAEAAEGVADAFRNGWGIRRNKKWARIWRERAIAAGYRGTETAQAGTYEVGQASATVPSPENQPHPDVATNASAVGIGNNDGAVIMLTALENSSYTPRGRDDDLIFGRNLAEAESLVPLFLSHVPELWMQMGVSSPSQWKVWTQCTGPTWWVNVYVPPGSGSNGSHTGSDEGLGCGPDLSTVIRNTVHNLLTKACNCGTVDPWSASINIGFGYLSASTDYQTIGVTSTVNHGVLLFRAIAVPECFWHPNPEGAEYLPRLDYLNPSYLGDGVAENHHRRSWDLARVSTDSQLYYQGSQPCGTLTPNQILSIVRSEGGAPTR